MKPAYVYAILGLALDQWLKYFIGKHQTLLGGGVFRYYLNYNFAWSWPVANRLVVILTLVLLAALAFVCFRFRPGRGHWLALAWLASGALSNLIDRIWRGGVADYIPLPGGAVINLADLFIFSGIILLLIKPWDYAGENGFLRPGGIRRRRGDD